jgi:hypothetical protein
VANPQKLPDDGELESLPSNTSEHDQVQPNQRKNPNLSLLEHLIQNRESLPPPSMSSLNVVAKHSSWIMCDDENVGRSKDNFNDKGPAQNRIGQEPAVAEQRVSKEPKADQIQQPVQRIEEMKQIAENRVEDRQIEQYELPESAS